MTECTCGHDLDDHNDNANFACDVAGCLCTYFEETEDEDEAS